MIRPGPLLPVLLFLGLSVSAALGQGAGFGSAQDTGLPVEVTADNLSVDQNTGMATFTGKVLIVQGEMRLAADSVTVTYAEGSRRRISALNAQGAVTLVSGDDAAEANAAVYDVESGNIVLTGDVLLTQGESVLAGDKVTVDLATGTANASGRVRSLLQSEGER
ncbi:lipopolysaccharide export system protein LptA [Paracoccus halophilus]|uniref:Lipopolysaccharide export system protein LptA n=1 Tax=Paracoccus halophilus TaxID=376733 RepID=A0A099F245_9RHOB|nr:lipopolysaccharide transport periplasmic protein LptA [Paracoccus halophilus]KGJ04338.1 organic solvent tolerance protein OstA [Paracoccus halophilus]SFA55269.1 lipopolysaccharide export system protein LptA [Paracoccus halophilus]